jgi:hypothetical protein
MAMVSAAGWRVERAVVAGEPGSLPRRVLRVSWRGYWQADCATTAEVAAYVDTATLVPEGWSVMRPVIADGAIARRASGSH